LITTNSKIKVQLILAPAKDEMSVKLLKTIFILLKSGQNLEALEKLKMWYNTDIKSKSKLKLNDFQNINDDYETMTSYNSSLFEIGKIFAVPSVYINGYPLPDTYLLDDIRFHITELEKMEHKFLKAEV